MSDTIQFLVNYGGPILFAAVFAERIGSPLPAMPWLLAAGALSAEGKLNLFPAIGITVLAALPADMLWFCLGRYRGSRVLNFLCRISLEPETCVSRTEHAFGRFGVSGVIVSKFVPGLSTVVPPLAGMFGVGAVRFLLLDGLASLIHGAFYILLGFLFSSELESLASAFGSLGGGALVLIVAAAVAYVGFKYIKQQRVLRRLRTARIAPEEVRRKQEAGEDLIILDLRSGMELRQDPAAVLGARHMPSDEVERRHPEIPRGREIIVYCACPNEAGAVRVALILHSKGITRVRPLLGGIKAWRERNYPTELLRVEERVSAGPQNG